MTVDITVIKLNWIKLRKLLLHPRLDKFKLREINKAYKVFGDDPQCRCQVPNILLVVEVLQLQLTGFVQVSELPVC